MLKYTLAITLVFSTAKIICEPFCPLTTNDGEITATQKVKQMEGTWSEYTKTADFLTSEACITYNIKCSNETSCGVELIQRNDKKLSTTELADNGENTTWGERNPFFLHVDSSKGYAILWDCHDNNNKTYELAVLMANSSNETKEIETIVKSITVTYASEPTFVNYTTCSDAARFAMNLVAILLALSSITIYT